MSLRNFGLISSNPDDEIFNLLIMHKMPFKKITGGIADSVAEGNEGSGSSCNAS